MCKRLGPVWVGRSKYSLLLLWFRPVPVGRSKYSSLLLWFRLRPQTRCLAAGPWEEGRLLLGAWPPWLAPWRSVTQQNTASSPGIYNPPPPQSLKPEPWWSRAVTCLDPGSPDVQQPGVLVQLQLVLLLHVVQLLSGQLRLDKNKPVLSVNHQCANNPKGWGWGVGGWGGQSIFVLSTGRRVFAN